MTDEINNEVAEEVVQEAPAVDYKALYEKGLAENEAMVSKNDQLLGEVKNAKKVARRNTEKEYAEKNGEFERLLKMEQEDKARAYEELNSYKQEAVKNKVNAKAMKLATELKAIPESIEITSDLFANELNKIADDKGDVSETTFNALKHQLMNDDKYKPLLQGNQSNGGGATGAKSSAHTNNTIKQADWNAYSAVKKTSVVKELSSKGLSLSQVLEQ